MPPKSGEDRIEYERQREMKNSARRGNQRRLIDSIDSLRQNLRRISKATYLLETGKYYDR